MLAILLLAAVLTFPKPITSTPPASYPSGATHYWAFQNDLVDGPGTCDLTYAGANYVTGKNGQCLLVDPGDNAASTACGLPAATAFSVAFWFKTSSGLLDIGIGVAGLSVYMTAEELFAKVGSTADVMSQAPDTMFDTWHLVVVTHDGSTTEKLSIDGNTFSTGFVTVEGAGGDITFMAADAGVSYDELATFTRALTQQEVTDIWNSGNGRFGP